MLFSSSLSCTERSAEIIKLIKTLAGNLIALLNFSLLIKLVKTPFAFHSKSFSIAPQINSFSIFCFLCLFSIVTLRTFSSAVPLLFPKNSKNSPGFLFLYSHSKYSLNFRSTVGAQKVCLWEHFYIFLYVVVILLEWFSFSIYLAVELFSHKNVTPQKFIKFKLIIKSRNIFEVALFEKSLPISYRILCVLIQLTTVWKKF